jgi:hypothetical protein
MNRADAGTVSKYRKAKLVLPEPLTPAQSVTLRLGFIGLDADGGGGGSSAAMRP